MVNYELRGRCLCWRFHILLISGKNLKLNSGNFAVTLSAMIKKRPVSLVILLLFAVCTSAQKKVTPVTSNYPTDYFRNPLNIPIFLAGNFGECRLGHFHSGVDIKTKGEENQPVHAAADGYVSRIKMEKGGFGHGLYITHPNGYTTLYAHLNDFAPAIQKYVRSKQYEKQQWNVDLQLTASQFPVKKGQLIAFSGNTGASTAPHLHFEIRNTKTEHPLNPQLFGLPIEDKIAPVPVEVAFYGLELYNSDYHPNIVPLTKRENVYKPKQTSDTVRISYVKLGIGIRVDDYMNGSDNTLTFYTAKLYLDDTLYSQITLDDIGYDESRYINAYVDYKTKQIDNKWIQLFFLQRGNKLDRIYSGLNADKGYIRLHDNETRKVKILITDENGNESKIEFYIADSLIKLSEATYSSDYGTFSPGSSNVFDDDPNVRFTLDENQLYDRVRYKFSKLPFDGAYSDKYQIHYPYVPIHHYFDLKIKPTRPVPFDLRSKITMMYSDGKEEEGSAAAPVEDGWYKCPVRAFGTYWLDIDTIPPVVKSAHKENANLAKAKQITLNVKDAQTSVKKFNGYIDDKWVCFEQHGSAFFYKFDEHCSRGKHKLLFKAEDENANATTYTLTFTR